MILLLIRNGISPVAYSFLSSVTTNVGYGEERYYLNELTIKDALKRSQ